MKIASRRRGKTDACRHKAQFSRIGLSLSSWVSRMSLASLSSLSSLSSLAGMHAFCGATGTQASYGATGTQASLPATSRLPRRQTVMVRGARRFFVLRTHAGGDACVPVALHRRQPSSPIDGLDRLVTVDRLSNEKVYRTNRLDRPNRLILKMAETTGFEPVVPFWSTTV
jgi:hypothetical protein